MLKKRLVMGMAGALLVHTAIALGLGVITFFPVDSRPDPVVQVEVLTAEPTKAQNHKTDQASMQERAEATPSRKEQRQEPHQHQETAISSSAQPTLANSEPTLAQQATEINKETPANSTETKDGSNRGEDGDSSEGNSSGTVQSQDASRAATGGGEGHYDRNALRQEIQGTVTVRGLLTARGNIENVIVVSSSGNSTIDSMGIRDMYAGHYTPYRNKEGKYAASYVQRTFTYTLR